MDKERDDFYTVGGTSGYEYFIDVHRINMREKKWEAVFISDDEVFAPNEPMPRYVDTLVPGSYRDFFLILASAGQAEHQCHTDSLVARIEK